MENRNNNIIHHHRNHRSMEAPVQMIVSVPVRAVPTFRHNSDSVYDEKHTVDRLEALSLKEGEHPDHPYRPLDDENLQQDGSSVKGIPGHEIAVQPLEEDSEDGPVPQWPVASRDQVIPTGSASTFATCLAPPMAAAVPSSSFDFPSSSFSRDPSPPPLRALSASSGDSVASSTASFGSQRQMFLIFIKILFKCLDQANRPEVRDKAKKIVALCTQRNRMGDPAFTPLMEAVEKRLRGFVGEVLWRRALLLLNHYLSKNSNTGGSTASSIA
jgi:hypothetical protein